MHNKEKGLLTRTECNALRGIAIIGIFLHNYCHWLGPVVKENEYQFFHRNLSWLLQVVSHADSLLPVHLLSFFGHYGVPVFLFLSAYGLTMKYERADDTPKAPASEQPGAWRFIRFHFLKLFRMMILGYIAYIIFDTLTPRSHHYQLIDIVAQLGLVNNLLPTPDKVIWPGPYWFFGLMFQLYIVYRLLMYRRSWINTVLLIIVCAIIQALCAPESEALNRWRYNCIGGMLPFGLGLLYARYGWHIATWRNQVGEKTFDSLNLLISTAAIWFLSMSYATWYIVPVFVCTGSIALVRLLNDLSWLHIANRFAVWMGGISAALFVTHPLTRKLFILISMKGDVYTGLVIYIVASILVAWLFAKVLAKLPRPSMKPKKTART